MTVIFVPKEIRNGETRVAATPETVGRMVKVGLTVRIEAGAGISACMPDEDYQAAGADVLPAGSSCPVDTQVLLKVATPTCTEISTYPKDVLLVSFLRAGEFPEETAAITQSGIHAWAMECVPRTTLAQKMDALSSQANIAGYKAVLLGATTLGKYFPLLMTAAGTVKPAKVVIFGVGVAGLQAIATAKRLGALVEATDIRPEVKEQVESLGAKFIDVAPDEGAEEESVYAAEASDDYKKRQAEAVAAKVAEADVVITTAQIPGRKAPLLIPTSMVETMKLGSVIVDLAIEQGGNCELSQEGVNVQHNGVTIVGTSNIPATVPVHASELYSRNLLEVVKHVFPKVEEGQERRRILDLENEITAGSLHKTGDDS
jgi:NAD(P) transhydrogenase subunit alpha